MLRTIVCVPSGPQTVISFRPWFNGIFIVDDPAAASSRLSHKHDSRESLRLAAIDVGSNSIHMIVAQADADGGITTLWRLKEPVGLGRLSFPSRD